MLNKIYKVMLERATPYLKRGRKYDYSHTKSIIPIAEAIIKKDGLDEGIILPAIIFHDIGWSLVSKELRPEYNSHKARMAHMKQGAKLAKHILTQLRYPPKKIMAICKLIRVHDYPSSAIHKQLNSKNELVLACIDFLWRTTRTGFWSSGHNPHEAAQKLTALKLHAKKFHLFRYCPTGKKIFHELENSRGREIKKKDPPLHA